MKKVIALTLVIAALSALAGCGAPAIPSVSGPAQEPASAETASETVSDADGSEAPAPEAEPAQTAPAPAREIVEVAITAENFYDYFEFVEFPEGKLTIETTPDGERSRIIASSSFYLKDVYTVAEERADDCRVEAHVKYDRNTYYYIERALKVNLENCSYELLRNSPNTNLPETSVAHDETLEGTYQDGQYYVYLGYDTVLNALSAKLIQNLKILSASGTLYLYA